MTTPRRIIVFIAASADGYIARPDGDVSWLDRPRSAGGYGMGEFMKAIDTVVWGRKTYDKALEMGGAPDQGVKNYVFTHRPPETPPPGVEFVDEPIAAFCERLRAAPGKDIWMMGGGEIIASFLDAGEIDQFIIYVMPVLIGDGIPLIAPRHGDVRLALLSSRAYDDGVVRLHYAVARESAERDPVERHSTETGEEGEA